MKKITVLLMVVCMLLISMSTSFAMSQKELDQLRNDALYTLNNTQSVTWYDLNNDPNGYANTNVKFKGSCIGFDPERAFLILQDTDGNVFIIKNPIPYRFKLNTEYTISATFYKMVKNEDTTGNGHPVALFNGEQAHLPLMSEYGL